MILSTGKVRGWTQVSGTVEGHCFTDGDSKHLGDGKYRHQIEYVCNVGYTRERNLNHVSITIHFVKLEEVVLYARGEFNIGQPVIDLECDWVFQSEAWLLVRAREEAATPGSDLYEAVCRDGDE